MKSNKIQRLTFTHNFNTTKHKSYGLYIFFLLLVFFDNSSDNNVEVSPCIITHNTVSSCAVYWFLCLSLFHSFELNACVQCVNWMKSANFKYLSSFTVLFRLNSLFYLNIFMRIYFKNKEMFITWINFYICKSFMKHASFFHFRSIKCSCLFCYLTKKLFIYKLTAGSSPIFGMHLLSELFRLPMKFSATIFVSAQSKSVWCSHSCISFIVKKKLPFCSSFIIPLQILFVLIKIS